MLEMINARLLQRCCHACLYHIYCYNLSFLTVVLTPTPNPNPNPNPNHNRNHQP